MDQLEQAPAKLFVGHVAEHAFCSPVGVQDPGLVVYDGDQVARMLK